MQCLGIRPNCRLSLLCFGLSPRTGKHGSRGELRPIVAAGYGSVPARGSRATRLTRLSPPSRKTTMSPGSGTRLRRVQRSTKTRSPSRSAGSIDGPSTTQGIATHRVDPQTIAPVTARTPQRSRRNRTRLTPLAVAGRATAGDLRRSRCTLEPARTARPRERTRATTRDRRGGAPGRAALPRMRSAGRDPRR